MEIVKNLHLSKMLRIDQDDLEEALRYLLLKKDILNLDYESIDNYKIKYPVLGNSDAITIDWKFDE